MMLKNIRLLLLFFLTATLLTSCSYNQNGNPFPGISFPDDLNQSIRITLADEKKTYSEGLPIFYIIDNTSEKEIIAPLDFNVTCYVFEKDKEIWVELPKLFPQEIKTITLSSQNKYYVDSVVPNISNYSDSVKVLIVLRGNILQENQRQGDEVGAFVQVVIRKK